MREESGKKCYFKECGLLQISKFLYITAHKHYELFDGVEMIIDFSTPNASCSRGPRICPG
jgi:hypothetical protein